MIKREYIYPSCNTKHEVGGAPDYFNGHWFPLVWEAEIVEVIP